MLKKYQLRNGLNVILYPSTKSPVISTQIWVNNGSADEYKGVEGVSHFIEHLVFKGSKDYKVGEIAKKVEASGGQLNAYTSFDQTVFYITLSKHFSDTALDMLSQMMGYPIFDNTEIDNEREVVLEEIKRSQDSLSRVSSQLMFSTVFKQHPYGIPVIGYDKVIKKISRKKIVDYYKAQYSPSNMTLIVVGDFVESDIKGKIKKYFAEIPSYKIKKIKRKKEPLQERMRLVVKKSSFKEARLGLSWKTVAIDHKDALALDLLAAVLGQFETSYLIQDLRVLDSCVNFIYASSYAPKDPGLFTIQVGLERDKLEIVLSKILGALEKFLVEEVDTDLIQRAVQNIESEDVYSRQTVDGIAGHIGQDMFYFNDPSYAKKRLAQLKKITNKDILSVFKKYLKPAALNVTYTSESASEKEKKALKTFTTTYKAQHTKYKVARIKEKKPKYKMSKHISVKNNTGKKVETLRLKNGIELFLLENHDTPLFHFQAASLGGLITETAANNGVTNVLSQVWTCGSKLLSESELAKKLEDLSISLQSFSGRNSIGLRLTSLSQNQAEAMSLLFDVFNKTDFEDRVLDREKQQIITSLNNKTDYPAQIASQIFMEELFAGHPYALEVEGTKASLDKINTKVVAEYKRQHIACNNLKMVAVGSFDKKSLIKSIEAGTSLLPEAGVVSTKFNITKLEKDVEVKHKTEKEQTHVFLGYRGLTYTDKQKYCLMVLEAILAGQGGRLFLELRDKESLAYSIAPFHMEGLDTGYFATYIACSPDKTEKAISMMHAELKKLMTEKVSEEDLQRAKRYLIGKHDISLQKNSSIASSIIFDALYGADKEEFLLFADYINQVSAEEVKSLANKIFSQASVTAQVGKFD